MQKRIDFIFWRGIKITHLIGGQKIEKMLDIVGTFEENKRLSFQIKITINCRPKNWKNAWYSWRFWEKVEKMFDMLSTSDYFWDRNESWLLAKKMGDFWRFFRSKSQLITDEKKSKNDWYYRRVLRNKINSKSHFFLLATKIEKLWIT